MEDSELKIIKAERLNALKARVKKECERRKYPYGRFTVGASDKGKPVDKYGEDSWDFNPDAQSEFDILEDQYRKISIPIRKINHKGPAAHSSSFEKVPNGPFKRVITDEDLTLFETNLTALESRAIDNKTSTDCSVSCTGTCTTACTGTCSGSTTGSGGDTCVNCASNCSGICGNSCSGNCAQMCGNAGCSGYCGVGCVGNCVVSCFSAASKAGQKDAAQKYGLTISPSTCLDSCVGNCTKGCGNTCGTNCGNACNTYKVTVAKHPFTGSYKYNIALPPRPEEVTFSTDTVRYWCFDVVLPNKELIPLSQEYPTNYFSKGIRADAGEGTLPLSPSGGQMNEVKSGNASIDEAMSLGYPYRIHWEVQQAWARNKADHYIGKSGNNAVVEQICRINILRTNYF